MLTLSRRNCLALSFASLASLRTRSTLSATSPAITTEQFNAWIRLRGGEDKPAYWYSAGLTRPITNEGAVTSRMIGLETWVTPAALRTATSAVSLSRKIFFFLHPERDELVTNAATGQPQRPSIFAFQVRKFGLVEGEITYDVQSHDLRGVRQGGAGVTYTVNQANNQVHVNYASFPRRAGPDGALRVTSGEVYDYFDNGPEISTESARYQMTWVGTNLDGRVANLRGWRYGTFNDIPNDWLKKTVRTKAPLWMTPPKDMAEIETLRATTPYPVPGLPV